MSDQARRIIVNGDLCIDWLEWPQKPRDEGLNWELWPGARMVPLPGGALLLAELVRMATGLPVLAPHLADIANLSPRDVLHSNAEDEGLKESNRRQADDIPIKLRKINCGFGPVGGRESRPFVLAADEVEVLAELEHNRWMSERRLAGWVLGPRTSGKKRTPYLMPWGELPEVVKERDRQTVRSLPDLLAKAKFEIYRM